MLRNMSGSLNNMWHSYRHGTYSLEYLLERCDKRVKMWKTIHNFKQIVERVIDYY